MREVHPITISSKIQHQMCINFPNLFAKKVPVLSGKRKPAAAKIPPKLGFEARILTTDIMNLITNPLLN
jgi:hypothetical protein